MAYSIERLDNPPAYLIILHQDFDSKTHMEAYYREVIAGLDTESSPVPMIVNIVDAPFSLNALMETTKHLLNLDVNPNNHPMMSKLIVITENRLMKLSSDGFRKLGIVKDMHIAKSLEGALALLDPVTE